MGIWTFGKVRTFEKLFKFYWSRVYGMCFYYLKDSNTSQDLTQNIFLDLWERGIQFKDRPYLERYLTKCCKYQVLNYYRYSRRIERKALEDMPEIISNSYRPDLQLLYKEMEKRLEKEMELLPEPCKTVFYLSRKEYMSYKDIALHMGISVSTVEYHISNALRSLRNRLR